MSTSRTKPFPAWNPDRLAEIAQASGQTVLALRAEIRERARLAAQPGHLCFEALQRNEFSTAEQQHLDACKICQDLHEAITETLTVEAIETWLRSARDIAPLDSSPSSVPPSADSFHRAWPVGWQIAASAAGILVVGALSFLGARQWNGVESQRQMAALKVEARIAVARDFAAVGEYPQANRALLTAFESSGMNAPTLQSVRKVLRTAPAADKATVESARQELDSLTHEIVAKNELTPAKQLEPQQALELSGLQMKSGETRAGYETLATYLRSVEGRSPAITAYETQFVDQLPRAN